MKVRNRTRVPTNILEPLVRKAAASIAFQHSAVLVKFTTGKHLRGNAFSDRLTRIVLPLSGEVSHPKLAYHVYACVVHELQHVADFQAGYQDLYDVTRPVKKRPCEVRAKAAVKRATEGLDHSSLGDLVSWLQKEGSRGGRRHKEIGRASRKDK